MMSTMFSIFSAARMPMSLRSRTIRMVLFAFCTAMIAACSGGGGGGGGGGGSTSQVGPIIVAQPAPQSVRDGQSASFGVTATGTGSLGYQWQRAGVAIPGATAATYTIPNAQLTDNGANYSVVVTNAAGAVTSASAALTVTPQAGVALLAGNVGGPGNLDGSGQAASFYSPAGVAIDNAGNVYVGDYGNHVLRKITPAGVVTTVAGSPGTIGAADGVGSAARFNFPQSVAIDRSSGVVYVADTDNSTIRRVLPDGTVTTLAGSPGVVGSADGTGAAARFNFPTGVATDSSGNVFVADFFNNTVRKITPAGVVTTFAGSPGQAGSVDGAGAAARFYSPAGLSTDAAGNVYVADSNNHNIRKITPSGVVTTIAGVSGTRGSADGAGSAATFNGPTSIATDASGNLFVTDYLNNTIRKITPAGVVTTIAGTAGMKGSTDGSGAGALFYLPVAIAVDASGGLIVADAGNSTIRRIDGNAAVTTFAGLAAATGTADGVGSAAQFKAPRAATADVAGNVYVADTGNNTIRKISAGGTTTTLAGSPGAGGSTDGAGAAAKFNVPTGIAADRTGNVFVADFANNTIRQITAAGVVTTLAGTPGARGAMNGTGPTASFNGPVGLSLDSAGNIYVADSGNQLIRKLTPAGVVTTYAGMTGQAGAADGTSASATFNVPLGVAADASGNVYVGDSGSNTVRKIDASGMVTTIAGKAGTAGSADGTGSAALFNNPAGVVADTAGNVYVADQANNTIRKVTPAGAVTTVAGVADGRFGVRTGALPGRLASPFQIGVDANGNLYSTAANGVLRITPQ